jgi:hypothetical protein
MGNYSRVDEQAVVLLPPRRGTIVQGSILTTPGIIIRIPNVWMNKYVNLCAMGGDGYFLTAPAKEQLGAVSFADSVVDVDTKSVVINSQTIFPLPQGAVISFYFDDREDLYLQVVGMTAVGKWYGAPSSPTPGGG